MLRKALFSHGFSANQPQHLPDYPLFATDSQSSNRYGDRGSDQNYQMKKFEGRSLQVPCLCVALCVGKKRNRRKGTPCKQLLHHLLQFGRLGIA